MTIENKNGIEVMVNAMVSTVSDIEGQPMEDNDTESQSFSDCIQELESVVAKAIDSAQESQQTENNYIPLIDAIISETVRTKEVTEEEAKHFCSQLKDFFNVVSYQ